MCENCYAEAERGYNEHTVQIALAKVHFVTYVGRHGKVFHRRQLTKSELAAFDIMQSHLHRLVSFFFFLMYICIVYPKSNGRVVCYECCTCLLLPAQAAVHLIARNIFIRV